MTFSIKTLSVILGSISGIMAFFAIKNPVASFFVALLAAGITEAFLRLQDKE